MSARTDRTPALSDASYRSASPGRRHPSFHSGPDGVSVGLTSSRMVTIEPQRLTLAYGYPLPTAVAQLLNAFGAQSTPHDPHVVSRS